MGSMSRILQVTSGEKVGAAKFSVQQNIRDLNNYSAERSSITPDVDCYRGTGTQYRGTVNKTRSGVDCVKWSEDRLGTRNVTFYQDEVINDYLKSKPGDLQTLAN